jgi:hypothetical protein
MVAKATANPPGLAMFLVRSIFWLTVAFLIIKPGIDLERTAHDVSAQAFTAGQQVIADQIDAAPCTTLTCVGGKAMLSAAISSVPSAGAPMHASPVPPVPLPRPRPDSAV